MKPEMAKFPYLKYRTDGDLGHRKSKKIERINRGWSKQVELISDLYFLGTCTIFVYTFLYSWDLATKRLTLISSK